ncbi:hypothetical protein [Parageobacillus thermoglucosidasius]|uniref:Uncharacterized protein n=1 Tax=Parageobacillus thermoglucosidasius TaxID=1426 RepID=A0A1B7KW42_PARTM|nr:hypothetical protein [Parageobacillus thermoglucosidasius]OAT74350.1 hypothetical protein A7K69_01155 [Parageobacillus thermoglucosidasius]
MKHIIFAIIAFVLAIPILLVLPVGLSWSGKIVALIIALLFSLLALVAKSFFPMWQLVLLLGLLMVAVTYLLHRQLAHVFYAANKIDDDELEGQNEPSSFAIGENDDALRAEEGAPVNEEAAPQNVSQTNAAVEPNEIIAVDELPLESAADIERIEIKAEHEFPWENEKNSQKSETAEMSELPSAAVIDEQQAEAVAESEFPWETVDNGGINEAEKFTERPFETSSTDMPFAELPPIVTLEMEENLAVVPDGAQETAVRDGEENRLHNSQEEWSMLTKPLAMERNEQPTKIEADGFGWDDILFEKAESKEAISSPAKQSFFLENEKMLPEKVNGKAQEAQMAEWNDNEWSQENQSDLGAKEQAISAKENAASLAESFTAISRVQSEILQTVVTELQLNRKYIDPLEYEQRVIQCLQTPLPDYGYYVFARLLMEHYLLEKQYDKLASLLAQLQDKFHSYPIIKEEIQFLAHILQKL